MDEGFNSTCHTRKLLRRAGEEFANAGCQLAGLGGAERFYRGLGGARSPVTGNLPCRIKLLGGQHLEGTIKFNELDLNDNCMLLERARR